MPNPIKKDIPYNGGFITRKEAAAILGITKVAIESRLKAGWTPEEIMTRKSINRGGNKPKISQADIDLTEYSYPEELRQRAAKAHKKYQREQSSSTLECWGPL